MKHLRSVFIDVGGGRTERIRLTPVWRAIRLQLISYRNPLMVQALLR